MQTIQKIISVSIPYQFSPDKSINDSQILLFDIETTGLSPDISSIVTDLDSFLPAKFTYSYLPIE